MSLTYSEKLKHPKWQQKRSKIYERDNWTCCLCDDTETTLHVHHKYYAYDTDPWAYEDQYLITYCADCHRLMEYVKRTPCIPTKVFKIYKPDCIRYLALITDKVLIIDYSIEQDKFHSNFIMNHSNLEKIIDFLN